MNVGRASVLLFTLGLAGGVIGFGAWYEFRPPQTASEAQPAPRRTDQSTPHALTAAEAADTRDDYATELKLLRPLAEKGNAHAQSKLGVSYYYGHGVPKDYAEAFSWFRKAAEQGLAQAQGALGAMYASGYGVPQDYAEAAHWYRQGAERGMPRIKPLSDLCIILVKAFLRTTPRLPDGYTRRRSRVLRKRKALSDHVHQRSGRPQG